MFFIFKIIPDWFWWLLPALGLLGFLLSYLPQLKTYELILKVLSCTTLAVGSFILGMLYCDNTWNTTAKELQAKVTEMQIKSEGINETLKEKIIYRTQIVKQRGADTAHYIEREVTKYDTTCVIPPEFVTAHNRAAEPPK